MPDSSGRLVVALLAVPESTASTLYGMYEILESAGRDWSMLTAGTPGQSIIHPIITSADGQPFRAPNGLRIEPSCALAVCLAPDVVATPDLLVGPAEDLAGRYEVESRWLRNRYAAGATFAAACTGAFILAEAGLLDGQEATTHWGYCDRMAARYPSVRLHPNRALVVSGEGRLEETKRLLETTAFHLDEIASRVGYEDATFLGRLFRRKVGLTPAQYRKRFRGLRTALTAG
jgi:transcriptional regulator GlxA family with amidase domain